MAILSVSKFSYIYRDGSNPTASPGVKSINDGNATNYEFVAGESVTITFGDNTMQTAIFKGTTNAISGGPYAVVEYSNDSNIKITVVIGTGVLSSPPVNVAVLNIDTTNPLPAPCFFSGTLIATPSGERKVEELVSGDLVSVQDSRIVPVKWIGRQTVSTIFGPAERLMPVRFAAGSLGGGGGATLLPHSDLPVTADHAMYVDGILCEAGALVNGTTITRVPLSELDGRYTVYHVETEAHEIVFANGAPAETFIDNATRRAFDNFAEFKALYGDPPEMKELPYPRASNARHLPARIKARISLDHNCSGQIIS